MEYGATLLGILGGCFLGLLPWAFNRLVRTVDQKIKTLESKFEEQESLLCELDKRLAVAEERIRIRIST